MERRDSKFITYTEQWYQRSWRPMMAFVYMILCILDYGVRPLVNYMIYKKSNDLSEIVSIIEDLDSAVQIKIIDLMKEETIKPILSEFVHLAFGAILGVAAFSRGQRKNFLEGSIKENYIIRNNEIDIESKEEVKSR
ncbi:MAG: hypothetical protein QXG00_05770 [Candidatus Woesearchaeota archaeon]